MLYRGINKANNRLWIIADDENEALEIAVKSGFVKNKKNCELQTSDNLCGNFYKSFKDRGNNMHEVDISKGVGCVEFKNAKDKGTWVVKCWW